MSVRTRAAVCGPFWLWAVEIVGCSSDHTIVDVTDSGKNWRSGDTLTFQVRYANMLYAFSGDHVDIAYRYDA